MNRYIQHNWGKSVHIIRNDFANGTYKTHCGRLYTESMSRIRDLDGHRKEDIVCWECRSFAAARAGKRVYHRPKLRHGLSKAKQKLLQPQIDLRREKRRLAEWNRRAQEVKPAQD